jgi:hypothetical protein
MNPPRFSVRVDRDELAEQDLAAALSRSSATPAAGDRPQQAAVAHHGARDSKQAARGRSERDHARTGSGKSRSYAFRRS